MQIAEPKWQHKSFFAEVDSFVPPWQPSNYMAMSDQNAGQGAVLYPTTEPSQRVIVGHAYDVVTGEPVRCEFAMPYQKYLRAMDGAGNIQPLIIKTCQIAEEDTTGFDQSIVSRKVQAGWLICERGQPNMLGLDGEGYGEYLRKEWLLRRRRHAGLMEAQEHRTNQVAERRMLEERKLQEEALDRQAQMSRDMVADMVPAIAAAVAQGLAAAQTADKRKQP
jgi:hypothetical protein